MDSNKKRANALKEASILFTLLAWGLTACAGDVPTQPATTSTSTTATSVSTDAKKQELIKLMQGLKLELVGGTTNPLCQAFLEDFRQQKNIEHLAPLIQTDDYDDPRLAPYKKQCPDIKLNKHVTVEGSIHDAPILLEKEKAGLAVNGDIEGHAVLYINYGTKNFKLWDLARKDESENIREIIFYDEGKVNPGPASMPNSLAKFPWIGYYRLINLDDCSIVQVSGAFPNFSTGVIRYARKHLIYELWPLDQPGLPSSLTLEYWVKDTVNPQLYLLGQLCTFKAPRK